ncbi:hypothetical protein G4425_07020 [Blautia wexlerae]|uniref:hypothetical protein n=1 Tax=Blautia wexlerae TaxID=418240 RepID=UPI00156ED269|nr:hypothetical protein [Blautia wexlerae]NSD29039.1 hypothetical protein [Blautia wexlerae]NSF46278.1 hypothetical protein [Blautia wexlerae]NSF70374.1 hypothetical protein [Blautia wexlerae]
MVLLGLPVIFAIAIENTVTFFLPFRFPFLCVSAFSKYRVASIGEIRKTMLMYGKEASNRKQEIDRQHYTIPNQRPKDKHCGKI